MPKLTVGSLYDLYAEDLGLPKRKSETKHVELLLDGADKVKTITNGTEGVPLTPLHVRPYIHQLLSGEIDSAIFRNYGEEKTVVKVSLVLPQATNTGQIIYHIETSKGIRMAQASSLVGIPVTHFMLTIVNNL